MHIDCSATLSASKAPLTTNSREMKSSIWTAVCYLSDSDGWLSCSASYIQYDRFLTALDVNHACLRVLTAVDSCSTARAMRSTRSVAVFDVTSGTQKRAGNEAERLLVAQYKRSGGLNCTAQHVASQTILL
eukprot:19860-Heterococcus_DN1.PRE.6